MPGWINEVPDLTPEPLPNIRRFHALNRCMAWLFDGHSDYPETIDGALAIARYHAMSPPEQDAMNYLVHRSGDGSRQHCTEWLRREDNGP